MEFYRTVGEKVSQLILGTVQLGMNYGVNNKKGKPSLKEAFNILNTAYENNIHMLDTASVYGESEKIIGSFMRNQNRYFKIVTKLKKLDENKDELKQVKESLKNSLYNLSLSKIEYYLYHSFEDLVNNKDVFVYLNDLKRKGIISKLGVSIYDTEELEYILLNLSSDVDFIQIPFNIFDLRWLKSDLLKRVKDKSIEVAARSIFLQGLFFLHKDTANGVHPKAFDYIFKLKNFAAYKGVLIQDIAVTFVKHQKCIDYILIGCENTEQLLSNIKSFYTSIDFSRKDLECINKNFGEIDKKIIDPRQWYKN